MKAERNLVIIEILGGDHGFANVLLRANPRTLPPGGRVPNWAIVHLFYKQISPYFGKLTRSKLDAVPLLQGVNTIAAFDGIPIEDVEFVRVRLVESLAEEEVQVAVRAIA